MKELRAIFEIPAIFEQNIISSAKLNTTDGLK